MKPARWATERNPDRLTHGPQLARVAEQLGFKLFEWQQQVADVALELNPAGDYHYRTVGVTVGRQNGKTALAAMRAALELLKPNTVSVVTAQDRNMARLKFTETCELLLDTPLKKRVKKYVRANGQEALYMNNGSSYRIVTPNAQGARGLTIDLAIVDEALSHDLRLIASLQPTMATKKSAQLWILSNAGGPYSTLLSHYRKLGHAGNPSLCWLEWAAAEECDIHDENVWYEAIPTLGEEHGVTIEAVREAVQTTEPSIFMSEWLNIWHTLKSQTVIEPAQWAALQRDNVVMGNFFCFGVDVSPNRDHASIGSAGLNGAFQCLEVVESQNRIGWLKERILELHAKWGMPFVIDSGAAASSLIGELEAEGVHVIPITMRQYGQACGSFYDAVQEKTISHLGDARLQNAIEGATRRKLGEQWAWSRKTTGDVDITPLVAVTIAKFALTNNLANPTPKVAIH